MSDPYGALALQRKGDLGVFDGTQWAASTQAGTNFAGHMGKGDSIHDSTNTAMHNGGILYIEDGTATHPITALRPTVTINRAEAIPGANDGNRGALFALTRANGDTFQAASYGVTGYCDQIGIGDAVGTQGIATLSSSSASGQTAYGGFFLAQSNITTASQYLVGLNPVAAPRVTHAYPGAGTPANGGVFAQVVTGGPTGSALLAGAAFEAFANTPADALWDVGFVAAAASVASSGFRDDSNSTVAFRVNGTHTSGLDTSGGTNTFEILFGVSEFIDKAGGNLRFGMGPGTGAGHNAVFLYDNTVNQYRFFTGTTGLLAVVADGTPGANLTSAYFLEGATPTLRRLTTFNPGTAGVNFTNGQLVCVMV